MPQYLRECESRSAKDPYRDRPITCTYRTNTCHDVGCPVVKLAPKATVWQKCQKYQWLICGVYFSLGFMVIVCSIWIPLLYALALTIWSVLGIALVETDARLSS